QASISRSGLRLNFLAQAGARVPNPAVRSLRAAPPASDGSGAESTHGRERQADVPAFAFAPARAEVINDQTLPAAHFSQGLLHRTHAAKFVCCELVAVQARLPFAVVELLHLGLMPTLGRTACRCS